jgi:hypothetical protein
MFVIKSGYRSILNGYHRLHVPSYWPWVASHLHLLLMFAVLNVDAMVRSSLPHGGLFP